MNGLFKDDLFHFANVEEDTDLFLEETNKLEILRQEKQ